MNEPNKTITPELKRKITERWNIITSGQMFNPLPHGMKSTALAQLEYILIEAGLLAQRRARPSEKAMARAFPPSGWPKPKETETQ